MLRWSLAMPSYIRGISSNNIQKVALQGFANSFYLASDFVPPFRPES